MDKLTKKSPFSICVLQEITAMACAPDPIPEEELLQQLHAYCYFLFTGFGQTKVVEDALKQLRDVEDRSVTNSRLERVRQWALLRDTNILGLHCRPELDPQVPPEPVKPHLPHSLFSCFDQQPTLQCEKLLGPSYMAHAHCADLPVPSSRECDYA